MTGKEHYKRAADLRDTMVNLAVQKQLRSKLYYLYSHGRAEVAGYTIHNPPAEPPKKRLWVTDPSGKTVFNYTAQNGITTFFEGEWTSRVHEEYSLMKAQEDGATDSTLHLDAYDIEAHFGVEK